MRRRRRRRLTGDVAVVVGAVVVLQEGDQSVQEIMRTQQNEFLQNIWNEQSKHHSEITSVRPSVPVSVT